MKRVRARAVAALAISTVALVACRSDGRDMQTPLFPPPAPTTTSTSIAVTVLPTG